MIRLSRPPHARSDRSAERVVSPLLREPFQRIGPGAILPALLRELGVAPADVFEGTGVSADEFTAEARLPMPAVLHVLDRAAVLTGRPDIGLLIGGRNDHRSLGIVGEMMSRAATLGEALRDYIGLQLGYSRGALVYLHRHDDDYALGYGIYDGFTPAGHLLYDTALSIGCNVIRSLTEGRARPLRVLFAHRPPADTAPYPATLKAPVHFNQEQSCIVISAADMELPLPQSDPAEHARLRDVAIAAMRGDLDDAAAKVRHVLRARLMTGEASREHVARDLGISPRTLGRQLAAYGFTFEDIKDQVRSTVARELLSLTNLPVGRIAEVLDYTTHSSFNHAFRRWWDVSPSDWRVLNTQETLAQRRKGGRPPAAK